MKTITYTTQKTKNKLNIYQDDSDFSPREWSNLGYFITCDRNYNSPDKHPVIEYIIRITGQEAISQDDHMRLIKDLIHTQTDDKVVAIYPIVKYEHTNVYYSLGSKHGFDYSNNGFYIITDKQAKEYDTPKKDFETIIKQELDIYNKYINGEVYGYTLFDDNGDVEDSCSGFYDLADIKDRLPEEWKNEDLTEYITYN